MHRTVAASGVDYGVWITQANTQLNRVYVYIQGKQRVYILSYFKQYLVFYSFCSSHSLTC